MITLTNLLNPMGRIKYPIKNKDNVCNNNHFNLFGVATFLKPLIITAQIKKTIAIVINQKNVEEAKKC